MNHTPVDAGTAPKSMLQAWAIVSQVAQVRRKRAPQGVLQSDNGTRKKNFLLSLCSHRKSNGKRKRDSSRESLDLREDSVVRLLSNLFCFAAVPLIVRDITSLTHREKVPSFPSCSAPGRLFDTLLKQLELEQKASFTEHVAPPRTPRGLDQSVNSFFRTALRVATRQAPLAFNTPPPLRHCRRHPRPHLRGTDLLHVSQDK